MFENAVKVLNFVNWSLVVATTAVVMSSWQMWAQRKHNRVSVTPHLSEHTHTSVNNGVISLQFNVANNGIGPAFINSFTVLHNGKKLDKDTDVPKLVAERSGMNVVDRSTHWLAKGASLAVNEKLTLFSLDVRQGSKCLKQELETAINEYDLVIEYSNAYKERFVFDTRED